MYQYKTKDGSQEGVVPGVGVIRNGVISSPVKLESPNLELVADDGAKSTGVVGTAPSAPSGNAVTEDTPVNVQPKPNNEEPK